jgi:hypothetical protein
MVSLRHYQNDLLITIATNKVMTNCDTTNLRTESKAAANKVLAIAGGQWLMEVLCFYFTFVLADSLVLRNARHRQAPNRYR